MSMATVLLPALVACLLLLSACTPPFGNARPSIVSRPSIVGVVEEMESSSGKLTLTTRDGTQVEIDTSVEGGATEIGGSGPGTGRLLLYGSWEGDRVWYTLLSRTDTGPHARCYPIGSDPFYDGDQGIIVAYTNELGIVLPKTADLDPTFPPEPPHERYPIYRTACLNEHGQVVELY